ncbi:MAG: GNAT family N-acetyltransferase, partial [Terriglobales bacterium]
FVVARARGQALGCAALLNGGDGWAEIKRIYVSPAARGHHIGRALLQKLGALASEAGVTLLRLETGLRQPEALALYRSAGFIEIAPFGPYRSDPFSVSMERSIERTATF